MSSKNDAYRGLEVLIVAHAGGVIADMMMGVARLSSK